MPPPRFVLRNGATFVGRATDFRDPLLTIRRATGGEQTLKAGDLQEVVIRDAEGGEDIGGPLEQMPRAANGAPPAPKEVAAVAPAEQGQASTAPAVAPGLEMITLAAAPIFADEHD